MTTIQKNSNYIGRNEQLFKEKIGSIWLDPEVHRFTREKEKHVATEYEVVGNYKDSEIQIGQTAYVHRFVGLKQQADPVNTDLYVIQGDQVFGYRDSEGKIQGHGKYGVYKAVETEVESKLAVENTVTERHIATELHTGEQVIFKINTNKTLEIEGEECFFIEDRYIYGKIVDGEPIPSDNHVFLRVLTDKDELTTNDSGLVLHTRRVKPRFHATVYKSNCEGIEEGQTVIYETKGHDKVSVLGDSFHCVKYEDIIAIT